MRYQWYAAVALLLPMATIPLRAQENGGQQLFGSLCAGCHGLDAKGGEHAPNIATAASVQKLSDFELTRIIHNGIPSAGMPGFGSVLKADQIVALVTYLRVLQGKTKAVVVPGSPEAGRGLFFGKAGCAECHMVDGKGGFIAADLSGYGSSHSPEAIRKAILEPNADLDRRTQIATVMAKDGKKYTGMARNEDNFSIQLQTPDGVFHLFEKADIASFHYQPRTLMPDSYGTRLTKKEIDDLVGYLAKGGGERGSSTREDGDF
ncbi:MAG TPA: c-type cytochrome [Bryobacteraceae bacterium]|nr:c-type cytochrome [Bryobacteraceae bacterium]